MTDRKTMTLFLFIFRGERESNGEGNQEGPIKNFNIEYGKTEKQNPAASFFSKIRPNW